MSAIFWRGLWFDLFFGAPEIPGKKPHIDTPRSFFQIPQRKKSGGVALIDLPVSLLQLWFGWIGKKETKKKG